MKYPLAIITAAATAIAATIRLALGSDEPITIDAGQSSAIPTITPELVEKYAYAGATNQEIADRFLMEESTIGSDFKEVLRVARAVRKITIRSYQSELAKKLNGPMLTWLGRNELGQSLNPASPGEPEPEIGVDELS